MSEDSLPMRGDLGRAFERLKGEWFYEYRGVNWEKVPTGWKWGNIICRNRKEMDDLIDQTHNILQNSIDKGLNKLK